jgi:hypothetical protein
MIRKVRDFIQFCMTLLTSMHKWVVMEASQIQKGEVALGVVVM